MRTNMPATANNMRAESLKSSWRLSFAWCCLLISLLTCFSFLVSWPILFLYKEHSLKCKIFSRRIPVLIYRGSGDPILASSIDVWSCHDTVAQPVSQLSAQYYILWHLCQAGLVITVNVQNKNRISGKKSFSQSGKTGEGFYSKNMSNISLNASIIICMKTCLKTCILRCVYVLLLCLTSKYFDQYSITKNEESKKSQTFPERSGACKFVFWQLSIEQVEGC